MGSCLYIYGRCTGSLDEIEHHAHVHAHGHAWCAKAHLLLRANDVQLHAELSDAGACICI